MNTRLAREVDADILREWHAFLTYDLAGDKYEADLHYAEMDRLLDERARIPHPRIPD